MFERIRTALERRRAAAEDAKRKQEVTDKWRNLNAGEQLVVFAQILKSSPELRALFRDALNVKGREELSAPGVRMRPELWTPRK
ncbi:MAG: hypothetical protein Q8T13_04975 [Acidobacteriota bacterium]|nr:hypothetical protein [Acidobacteriota bacterium]